MSTRVQARIQARNRLNRLAKMHRTEDGYTANMPKANQVSVGTILLRSIGVGGVVLLSVMGVIALFSIVPVTH